LSVFNALEAGFYRKLPVLRNLEAKFLKTENLRGLMFEMELGATLACVENTTLKDQVSLLREITGKRALSGKRW